MGGIEGTVFPFISLLFIRYETKSKSHSHMISSKPGISKINVHNRLAEKLHRPKDTIICCYRKLNRNSDPVP